jgi:hypothetical protein
MSELTVGAGSSLLLRMSTGRVPPSRVMSAPFVFWIDNSFGVYHGSTRLSSQVTVGHF